MMRHTLNQKDQRPNQRDSDGGVGAECENPRHFVAAPIIGDADWDQQNENDSQ